MAAAAAAKRRRTSSTQPFPQQWQQWQRGGQGAAPEAPSASFPPLDASVQGPGGGVGGQEASSPPPGPCTEAEEVTRKPLALSSASSLSPSPPPLRKGQIVARRPLGLHQPHPALSQRCQRWRGDQGGGGAAPEAALACTPPPPRKGWVELLEAKRPPGHHLALPRWGQQRRAGRGGKKASGTTSPPPLRCCYCRHCRHLRGRARWQNMFKDSYRNSVSLVVFIWYPYLPSHVFVLLSSLLQEKLAIKKKRKKEREALGDKAPPKPIPKTIENQRVYDETTVDPNDEEVTLDEATDEFAPYFNRQTVPKILITTSDRPRGRTVRFCEQLSTCIPNSHVYYRRGLALKRIIPQCISRDFTDVIVINEDRKIPNGLVLSHLPEGPTAHFRMSSVRLRKQIKRKGKAPTEHQPEIILNNFTTRLGHSIGRMFASLFPHDPQFIGRQVATFHNQRDYIFFRFHRYIFKNEKRVAIQELGPRFTLKLRSLQKGTFDSKFGEYEWIHKRREMDTSRRKFHL
ncbi:ribosome production factor 1 [Sceloporus undulatus]|uniref:ribosome production factor 1 n=1 Tax=Sceloporus undulatus TaxID=8520 RepID=UPI001C4C3888|nr:ribosome production factor 1 [Sceloporus undulatus]